MLKSLYSPRFRRLGLTLGAATLAVFAIGRGAIAVTGASAATVLPTAKPAAHRAVNPVAPLYFEPNVGQTDSQVRYFARAGSYTLFLTDREAVFALVEHKLKAETWRNTVKGAPLADHDAATLDADAPSATVRIGSFPRVSTIIPCGQFSFPASLPSPPNVRMYSPLLLY